MPLPSLYPCAPETCTVPGDFDNLDEAVDHIRRMVHNSVTSQRTLINLGPGSHLIKKKVRDSPLHLLVVFFISLQSTRRWRFKTRSGRISESTTQSFLMEREQDLLQAVNASNFLLHTCFEIFLDQSTFQLVVSIVAE